MLLIAILLQGTGAGNNQDNHICGIVQHRGGEAHKLKDPRVLLLVTRTLYHARGTGNCTTTAIGCGGTGDRGAESTRSVFADV